MGWQIVRYHKDWINTQYENIFYCEEGDIIKFGRVRFKIRKLRIQENDEESSDPLANHMVNPDETMTIEEGDDLR
jgi:hypothetical protein